MIRTASILSIAIGCLLLLDAQVAHAKDAGNPDAKVAKAVATDAQPSGDAKSGSAETPAAKPPETVKEAIGTGKDIVNAARHGHWALMVGLIVMVLTSLVNRLLKSKIPKQVLPWLAVVLGLIGEGALALHYSGDWVAAIFTGIAAGMTAGGSYSAFGKYLPVIGKPKPKTT